MSEKVELTQQQEDAIEKMLQFCTKQALIHGFIDDTLNDHVFYGPLYEQLETLSLDELIRAVYLDESRKSPVFKRNDYVCYLSDDNMSMIGEVIDISYNTGHAKIDNSSKLVNINKIKRFATSSEIAEIKYAKFFTNHNRKPWELQPGDILTKNDDGSVWIVDYIPKWMPEVKRLNETGYFLNGALFNKEVIKESFKIACFVDERLDLDSKEGSH